jgi:Lon protease-like protein
MTIPFPEGPPRAGRVVVVHRRPDGSAARVGTIAAVEGWTKGGHGHGYIRVTGLQLARVEMREGTADARPLAEPRLDQATEALARASVALRRYMAARAEAGEGGDVHVDLSASPITAANQVASLLRVTWPEIQDVLEAGDVIDRLHRGAIILERETTLLRAVMGRSDR